jgi:hypothetical protein
LRTDGDHLGLQRLDFRLEPLPLEHAGPTASRAVHAMPAGANAPLTLRASFSEVVADIGVPTLDG